MTQQEIDQVLSWLGTMDMSKIDLTDQLIVMCAFAVFAEEVKPVMIRNLAKGSESFIVKL